MECLLDVDRPSAHLQLREVHEPLLGRRDVLQAVACRMHQHLAPQVQGRQAVSTPVYVPPAFGGPDPANTEAFARSIVDSCRHPLPWEVVRFYGEAGECFAIRAANGNVVVPNAGCAQTALAIAMTVNVHERLLGLAERLATVLQYSWLATDTLQTPPPVQEYNELQAALRDAKQKLGVIAKSWSQP